MKATRDKGIICNPDNDKSYECWVDADFAGGFYRKIAGMDPMTSKSCSGWAITYAGCIVTWASKLQMFADVAYADMPNHEQTN